MARELYVKVHLRGRIFRWMEARETTIAEHYFEIKGKLYKVFSAIVVLMPD